MYQRIRKLLTPGVLAALKIIATAGLIALLAFKLDLGYLLSLSSGIDYGYLALAIIFTIIFIALRIGKWRVLTAASQLPAPFSVLTRNYLISLAVGAITPVRAGEIARITVFPKDMRAKAAGLFLFDRLADLWFVLLCALAGSYQVSIALFIVLLAAAVLLGWLLLSVKESLRWIGAVRVFGFAKHTLQPLANIAGSVNLRSPSYWLLTAGTYISGYLSVATLVRSLTPVDSWGFVLLLPLVTLSNVVPVTVGGLGIREGLAALLLPAAGISAEVAATAFFTTFLLSIVLPGVVGLCWNTALLYTKRPTNNANTNAGPVLTEKDKQAN